MPTILLIKVKLFIIDIDMALKKSELYSSLWSSCDELRGGMDASQYKDYVLVLLFIKYVSDKYANQPYAEVTVPQGASFSDMVNLKGKPDLGDRINKQIIAPLAEANQLANMPDFNDATKLGTGKEMVERLTNLIAIFENPALDFSSNRADGDDILGDAYEYLMRHFATESGKSKGQFYTPAEVSRVIAQILGIKEADTSAQTTVYDPTCGSGSLLLKVADEATTEISLYGQEKDATTSGLARMNMILHDYPTAVIKQGNTLANPLFFSPEGGLQTFDYVVANPPFSDKRWSTGFDPENDDYRRFEGFGIPPTKQGDYGYLLHILRSLKTTGKGGCILPHGVLFRGNAEAEIRRNLLDRGYIEAIIGLPANLFYGTGIPACIIILDKKKADSRQGILMIDASGGFSKDGNKNRLRERDIHRIVDVFKKQLEVPKYSRFVSYEEIAKNEYNLNIPRYIDSQTEEDRQDIAGHLQGGIPDSDLQSLAMYWQVCPQLKSALFEPLRLHYSQLVVDYAQLKETIYNHPQFKSFRASMADIFNNWQWMWMNELSVLDKDSFQPKALLAELAETLLTHYQDKPLVDAYGIYQSLLDYWGEVMQDDCYFIAQEGWRAETRRVFENNSKGKEVDKGWVCDLIPKQLIIDNYFSVQQETINNLATVLENLTAKLSELEEEYGSEEGILANVSNKSEAIETQKEAFLTVWKLLDMAGFSNYHKAINNQVKIESELEEIKLDSRLEGLKNNKGNITKTVISDRLKANIDEDERKLLESYQELEASLKDVKKELKGLWQWAETLVITKLQENPHHEDFEELRVIKEYLTLLDEIANMKKEIKTKEEELDLLVYNHYPSLSEDEIKFLVIEDKWMSKLKEAVESEIERISQGLTQRVKILAQRYEKPLPVLSSRLKELEEKVNSHLSQMGF